MASDDAFWREEAGGRSRRGRRVLTGHDMHRGNARARYNERRVPISPRSPNTRRARESLGGGWGGPGTDGVAAPLRVARKGVLMYSKLTHTQPLSPPSDPCTARRRRRRR